MNIGDIDDGAACGAQMGRSGLRQKQRRLEVAAHQIVPCRFIDTTKRCRKKRRSIADQTVESAELRHRIGHQRRN